MLATITHTTTDPTEAPSDTLLAAARTRSARRVLAAVHTDEPRLSPVLRVATRLATVRQSRLTVVTVLAQPSAGGMLPHETAVTTSATTATSPAETFQETETLLRRAVTQTDPEFLAEPKRSMCDIQVVMGDPDYEIPSLTSSLNADVLVIGRGEVGHGGNVLSAVLRRMRSARVCQVSPIPVIAVADPIDGRHPLDTVVIATDFSSASWNAALMAAQGAPYGACFHIVRVIDNRDLNAVSQPAEREAAETALSSWSAPLIALMPSGATVQTTVLEGESYNALSAFLRTVRATCVTVGGHRPRHNTISVVGRTVPERLLAAWPGSLVVGPYQESTDNVQSQS